MKYLHYYETVSAFTENYEGEDYMEPWVSFTEENEQVDYDKPDPANGHCYVDLGLPSGTKWACTNIGAENPEDLGNEYLWAETVPYTEVWEHYKYSDPVTGFLTKYCQSDEKTILELEDDVANAEWGGEWHIPTLEQVYELMDNTTRVVHGGGDFGEYVVFTSNINGNEITLPIDRDGAVSWINECSSDYNYSIAWAFCYGCEGSFGPRLNGDSGSRGNQGRIRQVRGVLGAGPEREEIEEP